MAITQDLTPTTYAGSVLVIPIAANTQIWDNQNVAINGSGYLVPCAAVSGLIPLGYSQSPGVNTNNNTGTNGNGFNCQVQAYGKVVDASYQYVATTGASQATVGQLMYWTNASGNPETVGTSGSNSIVAGLCVQFISATLVVIDASRRGIA